MAISLTSAGLYLEPRVYINGDSGSNYGTPKFVRNDYDFSGTWSGLRVRSDGYSEVVENVYRNPDGWGEYTSEFPKSFESKGGSINGYILKFRRITSKLSDLCLYFSSKCTSWMCSLLPKLNRFKLWISRNLGNALSFRIRSIFRINFKYEWRNKFIGNSHLCKFCNQSSLTPQSLILKEVA